MNGSEAQALGADLEYRPAWKRDDPRLRDDAIAFWRRLGILPRGVSPEDRARELVALAYKGDRLIGLATASLARLDFLRARFAMLRAAVDPEHRRSRAAWGLALYTRQVIEQWALEHREEKVAGLAAIIEAAELAGRLKEPWWPTTRLGLVGFTQDGRQIRVSWFDHYRMD